MYKCFCTRVVFSHTATPLQPQTGSFTRPAASARGVGDIAARCIDSYLQMDPQGAFVVNHDQLIPALNSGMQNTSKFHKQDTCTPEVWAYLSARRKTARVNGRIKGEVYPSGSTFQFTGGFQDAVNCKGPVTSIVGSSGGSGLAPAPHTTSYVHRTAVEIAGAK